MAIDKRQITGRVFAVFIAAVLLFYPAISSDVGLQLPRWLTDGYSQFIRWAGFLWLSLAMGPWDRLAPLVATWPGRDPHNPYGPAGIAMAVVGVMALFGALFIPVGIIGMLVGNFHQGVSSAALGTFAAGFGWWCIRASQRLQERAAEHDARLAV